MNKQQLSFLQRLANGDSSVNMSKSRIHFISPSQVLQQSLLTDSSKSNYNSNQAVDYDKSEDDSVDEQSIKVNQTNSINETNQDETQDKLPMLKQTYQRYPDQADMIDPIKYKYSEDKPFPLKLLNSNHVIEALEYLKYDPFKVPRIETIGKTLLFRKIYVYVFWIYYCIKFQNDLLAPFVVKKLREKFKSKYMKLFILTLPPKDDLFDVFPFIIIKAIQITIEKHLKNGKLILNNPDTESELVQIVHNEVNGFAMSHFYIQKNIKKYLNPQQSNTARIVGSPIECSPQQTIQRDDSSLAIQHNGSQTSRNQLIQPKLTAPILIQEAGSQTRVEKPKLLARSMTKLSGLQQKISKPKFESVNGKAAQQLQRQGSIIKRRNSLKKKTSVDRHQGISMMDNDSSRDLLTFKNQLKKILMSQPEKKKANPPAQVNQDKPNNSNTSVGGSWHWFGQTSTSITGSKDQTSMMSMTARFNKFETGRLSPMFTSFYSTNSFANPLQKSNIVVKKHITQSEERPESNFELLLRAYRQEKLENIEEMKKNNLYQLKSSNVRTLNRILGKDVQQKPVKEFTIKRRERKWVIGKTISPDGNIMTSPGLQKLIELKHDVDKLPTNFNFEKKILKNSVPKRQIPDIIMNYQEIADSLLPEYRDLMILGYPQNPGEHHLSEAEQQRLVLEEKYEKKMRRILKRKAERDIKRKEELAKELLTKEKELQKIMMETEDYQASIKMPYLKDDDVEYFFDNIFQEYAETNLLRKSQSQRNSLYLSTNNKHKVKGVNPFQQTLTARDRWATNIESQDRLKRQITETQLQRKNLIFNGQATPKYLKLNLSDYETPTEQENETSIPQSDIFPQID